MGMELVSNASDYGESGPTPLPLPRSECVHAALTLLKTRHAAYFKPRQPTGCDWTLQRLGAGRACLLADEMGMGKTFQAALLAASFVLADPSSVMRLVCPAALQPSWTNGRLSSVMCMDSFRL